MTMFPLLQAATDVAATTRCVAATRLVPASAPDSR